MNHMRCAWYRYVVLSAVAATPGCDVAHSDALSTSCRALGFCDQAPSPPVFIDLLCDASAGSSCTRQTLERALDAVLVHVADKPGSRIRLWTLAKTVGETAAVAERTVPPATRGSARAEQAQQKRFRDAARDLLLEAADPSFSEAPARRSPLAEALSKVGLAEADGLPRVIIAITDGREVSTGLDFECGLLPSDARFLTVLRRRSLLTPGLLTRTHVEFAFAASEPIPGRGCAVQVEREVGSRALWTAALNAAGADQVRVSSGPPVVTERPPEPEKQKEATK